MNISTKGRLADKIAGILNAAPTNLDPEEVALDDTNAQITLGGDDEDAEEEEILSKFRKQNLDLLEDLDVKYAGKKTSRRNLEDFSDEEDNESELSVASDDKTDDEEQEEEEEEVESCDDVEEPQTDEDEGEERDFMEDGESDASGDKNFKHMNDTNVPNQIKKGLSVRNQMTMWEHLLEIRIQLQKCLLSANKMPSSDTFKEIKSESDPEFTKNLSETKNTICGTLDKLMSLQKLVLKNYSETKNYDKLNKESTSKPEDSDEEILSDTEPEQSDPEETVDLKTTKKRKLEDYENDINNQHKMYKNYRNEIIKKWHDKTRVVLKGGGAASYSVLDQIEYNLNNNKDKLIKRTQLKRSQYNVLGEERHNDEEKVGEDYNTDIFDDDDFYHQLLRELIEVKSADITDPIQLGRQWIQLQNMRSKMKRKIDTKATKGRKIRYVVHNKLVNFMAPIENELWTDEAKTELYSSLFGKNQPVFNNT